MPPSFKEFERMRTPHLQNGNMGSRAPIPKKASKKQFTKHAMHTNNKNFVSGVMRGGIRF